MRQKQKEAEPQAQFEAKIKADREAKIRNENFVKALNTVEEARNREAKNREDLVDINV